MFPKIGNTLSRKSSGATGGRTVETRIGQWWDPAQPKVRFAGRLSWEPLKSPLLELTGSESHQVGAREVPMLLGEIDHGGVTLLGLEWTGMSFKTGGATQSFRVQSALFGVHLDRPDEAWLRRVEVGLPRLAPLLGAAPVATTSLVRGRASRFAGKFDPRTTTWSSAGHDVTLAYRASQRFGDSSFHLEAAPVAEFTSQAPKSVDHWLEQWVVPLNSLIELLTGVRSNPAEIQMWHKKRLTTMERATTSMQLIRRGVGPSDEPPAARLKRPAATLQDVVTLDLESVLTAAATLHARHPVFYGLLADAINYGERPLHNRFLDLTAALEAYDAAQRGEGPLADDRFKELRRGVVDSCVSLGLERDKARFLKRWLATRSSFSLENRLSSLAKSIGVQADWSVPPDKVAGLRNLLAHGAADVDGALLHRAFEQCFDLARHLALVEIGVPVAYKPSSSRSAR